MKRAPAIAAGAASLLLYVATCAPGLTGGDAGELIDATAHFGVAHPPGYPLYTLLGGAFSLLPLGSPAHRLNLFSALCGALACFCLAEYLARATRMAWPSAAAAFAFACAPLVWTWSTRAEVFALNDLCAAALLLASTANLTLAALIFGLGMGNQQTLLFLGAPLLIGALWRASWRARGMAAAAFALGLLVYLQLPLGTLQHAWGEPDTLRGFFHHLLRLDYGTFQLAAGAQSASYGARLLAFFESQARELGYAGVPLAIYGAYRSRRPALIASWLLSAFAFNALARLPLDPPLYRATLERFWLQPLLLAYVFAGFGLARLPKLAWLALLSLLRIGWTSAHAPRDGLFESYARAVTEPLPPGAIVLSRGDTLTNALRFADRITVLDQELLTYPWYVSRIAGVRFPAAAWFPGQPNRFDLAQLIAANPGREFYLVGGLKPGDASLTLAREPFGLTEHLTALPQLRPPPLDLDFARKAQLPRDDAFELAITQEYWEAIDRYAIALLGAGRSAEAEKLLQDLIAHHPAPPFQYFKNLAIAAARAGDAPVLKAAVARYLELAPPGDPDRPAFEAESRR